MPDDNKKPLPGDSKLPGEHGNLPELSGIPESPIGNEVPKPADPFDPTELAKLRLSQDFGALAQVKQVLTVVSCRKPPKQDFIRVRPGEENQFPTAMFKDEISDEHYMVSPSVCNLLDAKPMLLVVAISRQSPIPFLWPLTIPGVDGRANPWHVSAMEIAKRAELVWCKVYADNVSGFNRHDEPTGNIGEPDWSNVPTMPEMLRLAFKGRFIDSAQHPVLKRLRGEL